MFSINAHTPACKLDVEFIKCFYNKMKHRNIYNCLSYGISLVTRYAILEIVMIAFMGNRSAKNLSHRKNIWKVKIKETEMLSRWYIYIYILNIDIDIIKKNYCPFYHIYRPNYYPEFDCMNRGYFPLTAAGLKPQQKPMLIYISARVWRRRWYPQTSE